MADEVLNKDQGKAPERIENSVEEISADDLEHVSGGIQAPGSTDFLGPNMKVEGDLTKNTKTGIGADTKTVPPKNFNTQTEF